MAASEPAISREPSAFDAEPAPPSPPPAPAPPHPKSAGRLHKGRTPPASKFSEEPPPLPDAIVGARVALQRPDDRAVFQYGPVVQQFLSYAGGIDLEPHEIGLLERFERFSQAQQHLAARPVPWAPGGTPIGTPRGGGGSEYISGAARRGVSEISVTAAAPPTPGLDRAEITAAMDHISAEFRRRGGSGASVAAAEAAGAPSPAPALTPTTPPAGEAKMTVEEAEAALRVRDPLLASLSAYHEELLAQQAALQRKAATLVKKRAPRPGWFEDKTPAFTRELIRLNKLHSWNDPLSLIAEPAKHAWTPASVA